MKKTKDKEKIKDFFSDVVENIREGATTVGKKTKEAAEEIYASGSDLVEDTSEKIQAFTDKQHLEKEQHKIEKQQEELQSLFGKLTLAHYLKNESLHKSFLTTKAIDTLVQKYKENIKSIKTIDKKIKNL